jgi:hypothetical protein
MNPEPHSQPSLSDVTPPGESDPRAQSLPAPVASPGVPLAPPTVQGPLRVRRRRVVWPDWLGSLLVVVGAAGTIMGIVTMLFTESSVQFMNQPSQESARLFRYANNAYGLAYALTGVYLCFGGTFLAMRKPSALMHLRIWSVARLSIIIIAAVSIRLFWSGGQPGSVAGPFGMSWGATSNATLASQIFFTALWISILPVTLLIVFSFKGVRNAAASWKHHT